jgi:hypothetical protein
MEIKFYRFRNCILTTMAVFSKIFGIGHSLSSLDYIDKHKQFIRKAT